MTLKAEFRIEYHAKVFMLRFDSNFGPIEKLGWVDNCIFFVGKGNLSGLFVFVRIKLHLPLVGPSRNDFKTSI